MKKTDYMSKPKTETWRVRKVVMPSFLASALVNGDPSGLEEQDTELYQQCLRHCEDWNIVDCGDEYFSRGCDVDATFLGGVCEYTLLKYN